MQKIRKILRIVSEKTALPTNQPTSQPANYYQQHRFYRTWMTPVQLKFITKNLVVRNVYGNRMTSESYGKYPAKKKMKL